jgi:hypothetical protein
MAHVADQLAHHDVALPARRQRRNPQLMERQRPGAGELVITGDDWRARLDVG